MMANFKYFFMRLGNGNVNNTPVSVNKLTNNRGVASPINEANTNSVASLESKKGFVQKVRDKTKPSLASPAAAKKPVKTSVLQDIIALNNSVGIDEDNPRDRQIIALRKNGVPSADEMSLPQRFDGLKLDAIQKLVTFSIKVNPRYVMPFEQAQEFTGGIQAFEKHVWSITKYPDRNIFKENHAGKNEASATSFSLINADPLSDLKRIIESDITYEDKLSQLGSLKTNNNQANAIVLRYKDLKVTDSYKVTCIAIELELISEQINRYKKDLEDAFNSYCLSGDRKLIGDPKHPDVLERGLSGYICAQTYREDIEHLTLEFNEKFAALLEQRNEIEANHVQNYLNLTAAEKHPSIQKFKSEILSEDQFSKVFAGVTLSGIQFEALREIEGILLNPKSRSKPLVSFNMGEGKSFLIELVQKYAAVIERDKQMLEYSQVKLDEKIKTVAKLELQIEMHKEAINAQRGGRAVNADGISITLAEAKLIVKALEVELGKVRREVNQTRLCGLKIEIIDRANEETKLATLNAKGNLKNTLIFWDESRYGLQNPSQTRLGSQLRSFKDKEANLVLVGATVNEIKLVEAVNRARDKDRTKYDIDKLGHDLKEFRKRKVRAIKKITESSLEKENKEFSDNWAEMVAKNHGNAKKSQHVFLDLKLELFSRKDLEVGLRKIVEGAGPQIAMVNFIENGEYRCLIVKKGGQAIYTKVGNKDYYKAILRDSRIVLNEGDDRELTVDEKELMSKTKNMVFVETIAEIYGERYSIGGVYDKADVLKTGEDSQILYISKAEKINLAEIGQAQSRNRSSKPLNGKIVIQGDWASQIENPRSLAERALSNFEIRDLEEFVEDLDSKMAKYFSNDQSGRKCSEVLSEIELSNEERVRIIGGDVELIMSKFSPHIVNMEGDIRHKFLRDVKLFIHYSSLRDVKHLEIEQAGLELALEEAKRLKQDFKKPEQSFKEVEKLLNHKRLDYALLFSGNYEYEFEYEFDKINLDQSSSILTRDSRDQSSFPLIDILQKNEEFIDHFSRLPYSKKTQACLDNEAKEKRKKEQHERDNKERLDVERLKKMNSVAAELEKRQKEEDNLKKYLSGIEKEAELAREQRLRLEKERVQLEQELKDDEVGSEVPKVDYKSMIATLGEQLEKVNKRIADQRAIQEKLLLQKGSAVIEEKAVKREVEKLRIVSNVVKSGNRILAESRNQLQSLVDESRAREQALIKSEATMTQMQNQLKDLEKQGDQENLELGVVIAASNKKSEEIRVITNSIRSSRELMRNLHEQKVQCDERISSFSKEIESLGRKNRDLANKVLEARQNFNSLTEHFNSLTERLNNLTPQQAALRESLLVARNDVKRLSEDKKEKQAKVSELNSEGQSLNLTIQQAQQQISGLEGKISEITSFLEFEGKTKQSDENLVLILRGEITQLQSKIEDDNRLLDVSNKELTEKLLAEKDLQNKLFSAEKEQTKLAIEKDGLEKQIIALQKDRDAKKLASESVAKSAVGVQQKSDELDRQLLILESDLSKKNLALEDARQEVALLRTNHEDAKLQINELESQIASSRSLLIGLEEQVFEKSGKITSITLGIERIEEEMDEIKRRALAEEDIEKRTALTAAILEEIEKKQLELKNDKVEQATSELYLTKLRELSVSLKESFVRVSAEQETARQKREKERESEKLQLDELFKRNLESKIQSLTEEQLVKDLETQQHISDMLIENEALKKDILAKENLIKSETVLRKSISDKENEISSLTGELFFQKQIITELEGAKSNLQLMANEAKSKLEEKESPDVINQSQQSSLAIQNQSLRNALDEQKTSSDLELEGFKGKLEEANFAEDQLGNNTKDLRLNVDEFEERKKAAVIELNNMRSELEQVKSEKSQLARQIEENKAAYDLVKKGMQLELDGLQNRLESIQQRHRYEIEGLEVNIRRELKLREPEPDLNLVSSLQSELPEIENAALEKQENLQAQIVENLALQQPIEELTATQPKELEATKKGPAKVNMELPHLALTEELRVLNLNPTELRDERSKQHISERSFNHVIYGRKDIGGVTHIVAPITPSVLSIYNFLDGGAKDQRYYDIEFTKLTFQDYPKTAEGHGIFNDANLLRGRFRHCKFDSVDFSGIDPEIFKTINFDSCKFDGTTKLPTGFKLEDGKIEKSDEVGTPRSTMKLRPTPPDNERSISAMKHPRLNNHANKSATLLGSNGGGGREEG